MLQTFIKNLKKIIKKLLTFVSKFIKVDLSPDIAELKRAITKNKIDKLEYR